MKKITKIIIATILAILLGAIVYTSFQSKYNEFVFLVRHIALFTLLSIITFIVILYLYILIIKKVESKKHINYIKIFTAIVFIGVLYLGSVIQLKYIETYDSPILMSCSYYDQYGNILYFNHLPMSCEEPVVVYQNDNETIMSFEENYNGSFKQFWVDDQLFENGTIKLDLFVEVKTIHTDDKLTYYSIKWTEFAEITVDGTIHYGLISRQKIVENSFQDKTFISNQKTYNYQELDDVLFSILFGTHFQLDSPNLVSEIEYELSYTKQYGTNDVIKEFIINKTDILNTPSETLLIAQGLRKEVEEGEFIQISKSGAEFTDLSIMRYVFNDSSSKYILAPNAGGYLVFAPDITKQYGYKDNNLIINSFTQTSETFSLDVYSSLNKDSISVEVPRMKSYQKIFYTDYGYLQENYTDGITKEDKMTEMLQDDFSDMSYYYYNTDMGFLDYEDLVFEPWPELFAIDNYRPIFDFE